MTGRQFARVGVPGVFMPTETVGLPLAEVTLAQQLKKAGYAAAAVGKWSGTGMAHGVLPPPLPACLSVCLSFCLSACLSVCLPACLPA